MVKRKNVIKNRKPRHSLDANRSDGGGKGGRSAATVRRLKMYKTVPKRSSKGRILSNPFQSDSLPDTRIHPDRRWFVNTITISKEKLQIYHEALQNHSSSNYNVRLGRPLPDEKKQEDKKRTAREFLKEHPYEVAFGRTMEKKREKLMAATSEDFAMRANKRREAFEQVGCALVHPEADDLDGSRDIAPHAMFQKGQSKRIWNELYKVIDSSDVVVQVLDARDPEGKRCRHLEKFLKQHCKFKNMIFILNKCDLVPSWVTKGWLRILSKEYPAIAFHASINKPYGKGSLLSVLRQISRFKCNKQAISVGFVGYPNVGKSSVINTLRSKKVCKVAPIPGETKVWQYVTLSKRIFLIDCPGVVYPSGDSETDIVLKGVVRVANLQDAEKHIGEVLKRTRNEDLVRAYQIKEWEGETDFLIQLCRSTGRLLKGGEPDLRAAAKMVLHDWQRGSIPFFVLPEQGSCSPLEEAKEHVGEEDNVAENEASVPCEEESPMSPEAASMAVD